MTRILLLSPSTKPRANLVLGLAVGGDAIPDVTGTLRLMSGRGYTESQHAIDSRLAVGGPGGV